MQERMLTAEDDLAAFHLPKLKFFPEKQIYRAFLGCPICNGMIFTRETTYIVSDTCCEKCGATDAFADFSRHKRSENHTIVIAGYYRFVGFRQVRCLKCKLRQLIQDEGVIDATCGQCGFQCRV